MASPRIVERARGLADAAAAAAAQSERDRRVASELSDRIAAAGLYRMCVPHAFGGGEAPPQDLIGAVEALATGDAAPAWCVAVCATSGMLAAYLPESEARAIYGKPGSVAGGVFAPMGRAVPADGGFTVGGRWRFASNVENCDWLMGGCVVVDPDGPRTTAGGRPDVRLMLFEAESAEVIDTWSVSGLRGTGSHDIAVAELHVPAERSASLSSDRPRVDGPLYAFPPFGLLAASIAAVALGIARGALDDVAALACAKTPTMSTRRLAERPATQSAVARAEARLAAARAGLLEAVDRAWAAASEGGAIPLEDRARLRRAATHAVEASAASVDDAYTLGGGSAIYDASPLQRRFRDVHAATQHMLVGPATWEVTGRVLLGLDVDDAQL